MKLVELLILRCAAYAALGTTLAMNQGCKGGVSATPGPAAGSGAAGRPDSSMFRPTEASLCLQQMIKKPAGQFHLSFAESSSDGKSTSVEADVTPMTIDYRKREVSEEQTSGNTKKLELSKLSEMELDFDIMGPVPWHGELVAAQDAARAQGTQVVNGYNAMEYAIDTADEPGPQKATFDSLMAVEDYKIVGNAWVTRDSGCLVKYSIDFEKDRKNGSVSKTHFEGNVTKK